MPAPRDASVVERARVLLETGPAPLGVVARELGVSVTTLRLWITRHGWRRPPGAGRRLKLPREKRGAAERAFSAGVSALDIAALLGCDTSYVHYVARQHGWARAAGNAAGGGTPQGELAAIVAALREPALARGEAIRHLERAVALTAADALAGGAAAQARQADMIGKLVAHLKSLPEADSAPPHKDAHADPADPFPDADDLIEEIARRFEAFSDEWLDPRILAAVAAQVP